jgi:Flp pilus assembly protein TadG
MSDLRFGRDRARALHEDRRGAVLVEFMVAIFPLLTTFFVSLQVMQLASARLMVKHATILGARAAAVFANTAGVTPDQPTGLNQDKIENAVMGALGPFSQSVTVKVRVDDKATCDDPYGPVTVKVEGTVRCVVPLGQTICLGRAPFGGASRASVVFKDSVTMPHQGAKYKGEKSGGGCGE